MAVYQAFLQKLGHHLLLGGAVKLHSLPAQAVLGVGKQVLQGDHHVVAGDVSGNVVRVCDTDIGGSAGGNVGDHVVVDIAVVGVQPQVYGDIGIQVLELGNGLFVNISLAHIGIVFRPEGDLIGLRFVKGRRHGKGGALPAAVAACQGQAQGQRQNKAEKLFHPFVPPWETPSMIFFRKAKNSRINGTEITTTAAIMAGMFSRPKPFSRISWMPPDTR